MPTIGTALRGERGSAAAEMVTITVPVAVILLLFMMLAGRGATAEMHIQTAAAAAARAASLQRHPAAADTAAEQAATGNLAGSLGCTTLTVDVDTSNFQPGGVVQVTLTCTVDLSDLTGLAIPGTTTIEAAATSPVDTFRGTSP